MAKKFPQNIIIIGAGSIGQSVGAELATQNIPNVVVEQIPQDLATKIQNNLTPPTPAPLIIKNYRKPPTKKLTRKEPRALKRKKK